ncbi:universal stress protein [Flavobacteriaceae bacterium M23B6Z8]
MKKIIIPTDFSSNAYNAIAYALQLFANQKCHFFLVHAYSPPMPEPSNTMTSANTAKQLMEVSRKSAQDGLREVQDQINRSFHNPDHSFESIAAYGFLTDVIEEIGKEKQADLVVMGTKGASGIKELFLGSNTARVISTSTFSLIVVPETAIYEPFKEISFLTDYDYYFERSELKPLLDLLHQTGAELHVVHVLEKGDTLSKEKDLVRKHLHDLIKPIKVAYHLLTDKSLERAATLFIQSRNVELLCMVTKKHSFLDRLFKKLNTRDMSLHSKTPMLVLRREK